MAVKQEEVDKFEKLQPQLEQLHKEIGTLSKGKPDNPLNKFKLTLVNEKIAEANELVGPELRPFRAFERFQDDSLPTNSDVVLVLAQYLDALESWRSSNVVSDGSFEWYWDTRGTTRRKAEAPSRFKDDE